MKLKTTSYRQCLIVTVVLATFIHIYFLSVRTALPNISPSHSYDTEKTNKSKELPVSPVINNPKWLAELSEDKPPISQFPNNRKYVAEISDREASNNKTSAVNIQNKPIIHNGTVTAPTNTFTKPSITKFHNISQPISNGSSSVLTSSCWLPISLY